MKNLTNIAASLFAVIVLLTSCGDKKTENPSEILAGTTNKSWHISKQMDSQGDKEKLSSEVKDETLNLYANGKFSIVDGVGTATGKWSVVGSETLTLQFDNENVTENFSITELKEDKIELKAGDGSSMILKP